MDNDTPIKDLKNKVRKFCDDRDWDKFHNGKELATALIVESAELLEIFTWKSESEVSALFSNKEKRQHIEEEMADVLYVLLMMADKYNIDLSTVLDKKLEQNNKKYPIEKSKGQNKKYTEY